MLGTLYDILLGEDTIQKIQIILLYIQEIQKQNFKKVIHVRSPLDDLEL
jgi:predicted transcriptional regulator